MNTYEPDDVPEDPLTIKPIPLSHHPPSSAPAALINRSKSVDHSAKARPRKKPHSHRHHGDAVLLQALAPDRPDIAANARPGLSDGDSNTSSSTASVSPKPKPTVYQQKSSESEAMDGVVGVVQPHDHFATDRHSFTRTGSSHSSHHSPQFFPNPASYQSSSSHQPSWVNAVVSRPEDSRPRYSYDSNSSLSPTWQPPPHRPGSSVIECSDVRVAPQTIKPVDIFHNRLPQESMASDRPLEKKSIDDRSGAEINLPPMRKLLDLADRGNVRPPHRNSYSATSPTSANPPFAGMSSFPIDPNFGNRAHHHHHHPRSHGGSPRSSISHVSAPSPVSTIGSGEPQRPSSHQHRASFSASSHTTPGSSTTEGYPSPTKSAPSEFVKGAEASSHVTIPGPHAIMAIAAGGFRCTYAGCKAPPFQTQYLLNSHMNVHSDDRPHFCPHPGCPHAEGGRGFKRKNEMKRHQLVHAHPVYMCPFCPDRDHKYPRPDNLQRHVKAHHEGISPNDQRLRQVLEMRKGGPGASSGLSKPRKSRR